MFQRPANWLFSNIQVWAFGGSFMGHLGAFAMYGGAFGAFTLTKTDGDKQLISLAVVKD